MKRASVLLVLLTIALAAVGAYFWLVPRHELPDDLLTAVPADAYGVVRVDVPNVLASDAYKRLVVERGEAQGVERVTKACGFNPLERLRELVVFARPAPGGKLPRFAFLARGDLPHAELVECVKKVSGGNGKDLKREDIEGIPAVVSSSGGSRAAFIGRDGVIGGDSESVLSVINAVVGKAPGLGNDSVLSRMYHEIDVGTDVALVARVPDELKPLLQLVATRVSAELMPLADLRALSANATFAQGKIAGGAVLLTSDTSRASALVELARAQVKRLLDIPGIGLTPAGSVLRGIQMEARGERATFAGSIKVSTIEALLELLPAIEQLKQALNPQGDAQPDAATPAADGAPSDAAKADDKATPAPDNAATPPAKTQKEKAATTANAPKATAPTNAAKAATPASTEKDLAKRAPADAPGDTTTQ